jgi:hypothetical protein
VKVENDKLIAAGFVRVSTSGGLIGWVAKNLPEDIFAALIRDPRAFFAEPSAQIIKSDAKTTVLRTTFAGRNGAARPAIVKCVRHPSALRRLGFLFFRSPAARSLKAALLLRRSGFFTAEPLAALEHRNWNDLGTSYYVAVPVDNSCSLREFWRSVAPALASAERLRLGRSIIRQLAELFYRLHAAGIYHGDLKGGNILIEDWKNEARRFYLIDLDRVQARRSVPQAKRLKNLLQVKVSWRRRERVYFYRRYAALCSASKTEAKALVRRALDLWAKQARPAARACGG